MTNREDESKMELREALLRMEHACEQLAATRSIEIYTAMIDGGQTEALLELDNARRAARAALTPQGEETPALQAPAPQADVEGWCPPQACDGKEQYAFEAWASESRYDMHEHPMHYIFMDPKTNAARMGWNAALQYVREQFAEANPPPETRAEEPTPLPEPRTGGNEGGGRE